MSSTTVLRAGVGTAALVLALSGCSAGSSDSGLGSAPTMTPSAGSTAATNAATTQAADLRATLTQLLHDHVNLTTAVVAAATETGDPSSPRVKGAEDALGQNTKDLTDAIAGIYGADGGKKFNALWSSHIGFFVNYTLGDLKHDAQMKQQALKDLAGYREDFGRFINVATKDGVPVQDVMKILAGHVQTLTAAIDAITSKSPDAAAKTYAAAQYMSTPAMALSGAFAGQFPDKFAGSTTAGGAKLRAALTGLLTQHVNQTAQVVRAATATGNPSDPRVKGAEDALGQNTQDLTDAIASIYGDAGAKQFKALWTAHIGFFVNYTLGDLKHDAQMKQQALKDLDGYRQDFGTFIYTATKDGVPTQDVMKVLAGHVQTLTAAIDAITSKSPDAAAKTYTALKYMSTPATALSQAFTTRFPQKFGS